jgi:signal transduction histidine kinase
MITDQAKRLDYLRKLRHESLRLSHLVENVLAYSRLSGPRRGPARQRITLGELVERSYDNLADLSARAGMQLVVEAAPEAAAVIVEADVAAVEQILVNLVDNACKYAAGADDRRIRVAAAREGSRGVIRVIDDGPGIAPAQRRGLFRDFSRSAADAAGNSPGVGLGLAISRRLARQMRGELRLEKTARGAMFALQLRLA